MRQPPIENVTSLSRPRSGPLPPRFADFAVSGSKIGVQIHMTGPGTTKLYVDSIFFDS